MSGSPPPEQSSTLMDNYADRLMILQRLLELEEIDAFSVRVFCFDYGIPEVPGLRQTIWKLLLKYLPWEREHWEEHLTTSRELYFNFVKELIVNPYDLPQDQAAHDPLGALTPPSDSESPASGSEGAEDPTRAAVVVAPKPLPQSSRPAEEDEDADDIPLHRDPIPRDSQPENQDDHRPIGPATPKTKWEEYYQDQDLRQEIQKDVSRTHSSFHFFARYVDPARAVKESQLLLEERQRRSEEAFRQQQLQKEYLDKGLSAQVDKNGEKRGSAVGTALGLFPQPSRSNTNLFASGGASLSQFEQKPLTGGLLDSDSEEDHSTGSSSSASPASPDTPPHAQNVPDRSEPSPPNDDERLRLDAYRRFGPKPKEDETHADVLLRILFIFAKLNPGIRYVQGMNEILAPVYFVFARDATDVNAVAQAEADAFFCFTNLMGELRDLYMKTFDTASYGILAVIEELNLLLQVLDPELWQHYQNTGVDMRLFAFRWILLLLSQEFELPEVLRLWDSLFSDENRFELLNFVCISMQTCVRDQLLSMSFAEILELLQHYSENVHIDIQQVLVTAGLLRQKFQKIQKEANDSEAGKHNRQKSRNFFSLAFKSSSSEGGKEQRSQSFSSSSKHRSLRDYGDRSRSASSSIGNSLFSWVGRALSHNSPPPDSRSTGSRHRQGSRRYHHGGSSDGAPPLPDKKPRRRQKASTSSDLGSELKPMGSSAAASASLPASSREAGVDSAQETNVKVVSVSEPPQPAAEVDGLSLKEVLSLPESDEPSESPEEDISDL